MEGDGIEVGTYRAFAFPAMMVEYEWVMRMMGTGHTVYIYFWLVGGRGRLNNNDTSGRNDGDRCPRDPGPVVTNKGLLLTILEYLLEYIVSPFKGNPKVIKMEEEAELALVRL